MKGTSVPVTFDHIPFLGILYRIYFVCDTSGWRMIRPGYGLGFRQDDAVLNMTEQGKDIMLPKKY